MHIGLSRPSPPPFPVPDVDAAVVAVHAERVGFESLVYGEHPIRPLDQPGQSVYADGIPFFQDTLVAMARISAATTTLTFGGGVFLVPEHNPIQFAKELASLDHYSRGRLLVGAGIGWSRIECELLGGRWDRRWAQTRESVRLMKRLWTEETVAHEGEIYSVPPVQLFPKPARPGGPPVLLGGAVAAEPGKLFDRIVDYADGWMPAFYLDEDQQRGPDIVAAGRRALHEVAAAAGRDPATFQISVIARGLTTDGVDDAQYEGLDRTLMRRYEDAGVDRVMITVPRVLSEDDVPTTVERLAEAVL